MLVDLTPIDSVKEQYINILKSELNIADEDIWKYIQSDPRLHEETGIYWTMMNFNKFFFEETINLNYENEYWHVINEHGCVNSYGVADNIEQIKEYYKHQIENKNEKYIISLYPVFQNKENKGKEGGWRWHKWGPYIGELDSKCEYLDDEDFGPDFKGYVICFHCYKIN